LFDTLKSFAGKAAGAMRKVAHSPFGKLALSAGGVAIASKFGSDAGMLFHSASQSLHLADLEDTQADEYDQQAQNAEDDGNQQLAMEHRQTAQLHRNLAAHYRSMHEKHKQRYNDESESDFDDDYNQNVAPKLHEHARKHYPEKINDDDGEESDDGNDGDSDDDGDQY
jgi:hypothetical protein